MIPDTGLMDQVITLLLGIACTLVLVECGVFALHLSHLVTLAEQRPGEPESWPRVSMVIAARDEAASAGEAMSSRLAEDYPELEVIFVDDRSGDDTAARVEKAGRDDPRLSLIRVDTLPPGWLGKVHALYVGTQAATGEWLLFTDADVHIARGAIRKAVAFALAEDLDMLALVPEYRTGNVLVDAIWADFMRALALMVDPAAVRDPDRRTVIGSGAFNLVRRTALDRTPGFEHLRLETGDDVALGKMVKDAKGSIAMMNGRTLATVAIYRSVGDYLRGVEKNGSSLADRPFVWVLGAFALLLAVEYAPLAAVAWALAEGPAWLLMIGATSLAATTAVFCVALWTNTRTWAAGLLWPAGVALMVYGVARSAFLAHRRGGVMWRGTFYALSDLHEGRRFKL